MKKIKTWLIIAFSLIFIGGIFFGGIMTMLKWDFTKLSTSKCITNSYDITDDYKNISITNTSADIVFVPCEDSKSSVVCHEWENAKCSVTVKDNTLIIEMNDTRRWYEYIGFSFDTPKITVAIPKGEYGTLSIKGKTGDANIPKDFIFKSIDISKTTGDITNCASALEGIKLETTTGDISAKNISANSLDLSVSTGKIIAESITCNSDIKLTVSTGDVNIANVQCENIYSDGSTGDLVFKNAISKGKFSISRSTGDVIFKGCDANEIFVKVTTGDVKGNLLSEKLFVTNTSTGDVNVPKTTSGGKCEITTSTGDIKITID